MASDNKLELVIQVQADKANAQIKNVNQSLAGIERIAVSVAQNASAGIKGMTACTVKGSLAGNLLVKTIRGAAEWVKEYVAGAVEMAAHTERLRGSAPTCSPRSAAWRRRPRFPQQIHGGHRAFALHGDELQGHHAVHPRVARLPYLAEAAGFGDPTAWRA
jgi:hypothetical protein